MPRGDGTGPNGLGSMTGRAAGYCAGYGAPGFANGGFGRGNGGGRGGFGRGYRNQFLATGLPAWARGGSMLPEADEKQFLANQAKALQAQLEEIQKRQKELDAE